jgi:2-hydroxychromene-2-carboxylate isomerase
VAVDATLYTDPGCPWAYSASPALTALRWRYGDQLNWRLVVIGLSEDAQTYIDRGYTPQARALGYRAFRDRFGMPFDATPRPRLFATGRACRAIVATRLRHPGREFAALRALQLGWFTTPAMLDEDDAIAAALESVDGVDAARTVASIDAPNVEDAYQQDRAEARTAAGSPTEFQGKAAASDGPVRYTAPSVIFSRAGQRLEAGGFQPLEAYDVVIANLDRSLARTPQPADPLPALRRFTSGMTTQEVAAVLAPHLVDPDRVAAEEALVALVSDGKATREPRADDAIWRAA